MSIRIRTKILISFTSILLPLSGVASEAIGSEERTYAIQIDRTEKKSGRPVAERPPLTGRSNDMEDRVTAIEELLEGPLLIKMARGRLNLSGYIQTLYRHKELVSYNDTFSMPRARLTVNGDLAPELSYYIQVDAAASSDILRDAYVVYKIYPYARLVVGQTFIPFSEDQLFPTSKRELIDLTRVASSLSYDRDIGVQLQGELFSKRLSYGAGVFNGTGKNTTDDNDSKDFISRAVVSPLKGRPSPLQGLSLGASFQYGRQPRLGDIDGDRTVLGALALYEDDTLKIQGEYIFRRQERTPGLDDRDSDGWYLMSAYYFFHELQGAIRYERFDPDRDAPQDKEDILALGLNYFFGNHLKLQADYLFKDEETEVDNDEFALLLQLKF